MNNQIKQTTSVHMLLVVILPFLLYQGPQPATSSDLLNTCGGSMRFCPIFSIVLYNLVFYPPQVKDRNQFSRIRLTINAFIGGLYLRGNLRYTNMYYMTF